MSLRTQTSPGSSAGSGPAFILRCRRSRLLAGWWLAVHSLAAAGALAAAWIPGYGRALLAAVVIAHALARSPARPPLLVRRPDGCWALPERGLAGLELASGSGLAPWWIRLVLVGGDRRLAVTLVRDQLDAETWRALQAALRRGGPPRQAALLE